jgi:hypothetical protein
MIHAVVKTYFQIIFLGEKRQMIMMLWREWWRWARGLREACSRKRTFMWLLAVLMGFSVRQDLLGATSLVRALGLQPICYGRILDFFHTSALDLGRLTRIWAALVLKLHPGLLRCNGRVVLAGDGIKVAKSGKKMPAIKKLHQSSESNTKPSWIMGHSCQAVSILACGLSSVVAIPLSARIHEGLVFSNRSKLTLLDKMIALIESLSLGVPFYFVGDAYYASRKVALPLLEAGNHLITRVKSNSVAYFSAPVPECRKRGRPKVYGEKIALKTLLEDSSATESIMSPVYGERGVQIRVRSLDLLWRPVGVVVRFVAVSHPTRGQCLLMSTDLELEAVDIIRLYGYRFKIEVAFKQSLHVVGAFLYHFWMAPMKPLRRNSGNQYLHRTSAKYREAVRRKMDAYHRFMQIGLISQGIMLALATTMPEMVWRHFGSWLRTRRPGICPSERVVATALRNSLPDFLADDSNAPDLTIFLCERMDFSQTNATRLAA